MRIDNAGGGGGVTRFTVLRFSFKPKTVPAIKWTQLANGNWRGIDRGYQQDKYYSEVYFYGNEAEINNIITQIEINRQGSSLLYIDEFNSIDDQLFGADIDYSGGLDVTIVKWEKRKQKSFKVFELKVTFLLVESTIPFTGTPSNITLKPIEGYIGTSDYTINKLQSYTNNVSYIDHNSDSGIFEGTFQIQHSDMNKFRRYLLSTIRAGTLTISDFAGVSYPFGPKRGSYPINTKVLKFIDQLLNVNYWQLKLTLAEEK